MKHISPQCDAGPSDGARPSQTGLCLGRSEACCARYVLAVERRSWVYDDPDENRSLGRSHKKLATMLSLSGCSPPTSSAPFRGPDNKFRTIILTATSRTALDYRPHH